MLKRNLDTELFLDPRTLRNLFRSSFLVVLQPVDCKPLTPVKMEFLEISRRPAFLYITMHMMEFSPEFCRIRNPAISLKRAPNTDAVPLLLKYLLLISNTHRKNFR